MDEIDISGMDKAAVLAALYNRARVQGMGFLQAQPGDMPLDEANIVLKNEGPYFDYLRGRVMKVNLKGDSLRVGLYDRDNGKGAAERALRDAGLLTP